MADLVYILPFGVPIAEKNEGGLVFLLLMLMYRHLSETGLGCDILICNSQIGSKNEKGSRQRYCEINKFFLYLSYISLRVSLREGPGEREH